jgi:hypothetical protein
VTLAIKSGTPTSGGPGTLSGCSQTEISGVVTFSGCSINTAGTNYRLRATDGSLSATDSAAFNITVGPSAQLLFTQQPSSSTGGVALPTQPKVAIEDAGGNIVTSDSSTVTLAIGTNPGGGTLSGCTQTESNGVVTFSGCKIDKAGNGYTLTASENGLTSATSNTFNITVGSAAQLAFTQQPVGNVAEATNFTTSPKVSIEDAGGNVVTTDSGSVTLAINNYSAGNGGTTSGSLTCSNAGFPTISAVNGVATFTNCQISGSTAAGTYTLKATRAGLTTGTSTSLTINPGTATKLVFTTQPSNAATKGNAFAIQPVVSIEDANGNVVVTNSSSVTLSLNNPGNVNGANLACSTNPLAATSGAASFSGCSINKAGTFSLHAADGALTATDSSSITVS